MASIRKDFTLKEARDVTLAFEVVADEDQVITDSAIDFWIARHVGSVTPLVTKSVDDGITITGDLTFEVKIDAEDTEGMEGLYYYEVRIEAPEPDSCRVTSTYGYITFEASLIGAASA